MELVIIISAFVIHGIFSILTKHRRAQGILSIITTGISLVLSVVVASKVAANGVYNPFTFIAVEQLGAVLMLVVSIVALFAAIYAMPYLRREQADKIIGKSRVSQYYAMTSAFLASIFLAISVNNPVAAWIFLEATTLSTVFLVSFYNRPSTIEAAWKYMIINAVGLLLAFFGTLLYFTMAGHDTGSLNTWQALANHVKQLDPALVKTAFVFVLIGYGTKIGLAPMHTWKPDSYDKAPAPLGALFSGALMPVALMILLRFKSITDGAIGPTFSSHLLIGFGLLSVVVGALSILSTHANKKLLAYSSIEHAGLIMLGIGFGGIGALAAILHIIYHSLVKSSLFFLTGNMLLKYHSTYIKNVRGAIKTMPFNSIMYFMSAFAVAGLPPFGIFLTEAVILLSGIKHYLPVVIIALGALVVAFIGMFRAVGSMTFGEPPQGVKNSKSSLWLLVPSGALLAIALVTTFYIPEFIKNLIHAAAGKI